MSAIVFFLCVLGIRKYFYDVSDPLGLRFSEYFSRITNLYLYWADKSRRNQRFVFPHPHISIQYYFQYFEISCRT